MFAEVVRYFYPPFNHRLVFSTGRPMPMVDFSMHLFVMCNVKKNVQYFHVEQFCLVLK